MFSLSCRLNNRALVPSKLRSFILSSSVYPSCRTLTTTRLPISIIRVNSARNSSPLSHFIFTSSKKRDFWSFSESAPAPAAAVSTPAPSSDSSSNAPSEAVSTPSVADADVPSPDIFTTLDVAPLSSVAPHDLEFGTLKSLGLASNFTPVGWIQSLLEAVNVSTGLPWYTTIILTAALVRFIGIPFTLRSTRASANMIPIRPQYEKLMNELKVAASSGDAMKRNLIAMQVRAMQKEHGISPWKLMQGPVIQVVSSISGFIAIKRLCDLPLEQLKVESLAWIPSLTAADPTYILPVLSVAAMNIQMRLGRVDVLASGSKAALHFGNVFPILSVASLAVLSFLPSGILLHLLTNITLISTQSAILRIPAIRTKLKLPLLSKPSAGEIPTYRDTINAAKAWFAENRKQALEAAERRVNAKQVNRFPVKPDPSSNFGPGKRSFRRRS